MPATASGWHCNGHLSGPACVNLPGALFLQALHDNATLQAKAGALAAPLARVINDGISKPALRADAMAGLLMAACIAPAAADADALFEKEKVRGRFLFDFRNFLLSPFDITSFCSTFFEAGRLLSHVVLTGPQAAWINLVPF